MTLDGLLEEQGCYGCAGGHAASSNLGCLVAANVGRWFRGAGDWRLAEAAAVEVGPGITTLGQSNNLLFVSVDIVLQQIYLD